MAEFDLETVNALNTLLEDERASVEMEVALASGATEYAERETLTAMGADDVGFCIALHERLDRAGAPVSRRINGVVFQALGAERYDDRLLVFARHQMMVNERRHDLDARDLDDETRDLIQTLVATHERHIAWCERRALAFSATRQLEFRSERLGATGGASGVEATRVDVEQEAPRVGPQEPDGGFSESGDEPDDQPGDEASGEPHDESGEEPHDELQRDLSSARRRATPGRRETRAPYTPGTPIRGAARYSAFPTDDATADEYTPPPTMPYPPSSDDDLDSAPIPPALPTPTTPPTVRRRYGAYRPGAANPPYNIPPLPADSSAPDDAPTKLDGDAAYPYGAPGYTAFGGYPDERDGDN